MEKSKFSKSKSRTSKIKSKLKLKKNEDSSLVLPILKTSFLELNQISKETKFIEIFYPINITKSSYFYVSKFLFIPPVPDDKLELDGSSGLIDKLELKYDIREINLNQAENKQYQIYFKTYKNTPKCIIDPLSESKCIMTKSLKNANIIWKLYKFEKMIKIINSLNKNQKYNHFPKTFQLGRKDNLWRNFKKFFKLFPKDYNYMPETYIFPQDITKFQAIKNINSKSWIVKPVASSRGRGVHLLTDPGELNNLYSKTKQEYLISKYIENPHLINGRKYDLRIYVLITSFTPLRIYFYKDGLVRFASEEYTAGDKENIYVHLTNYAINKKNTAKANDGKWGFDTYCKYFSDNSLEKECETIFSKIKDIIIKSIITISEESTLILKGLIKNKNSLFELYGFDILIDDKFNLWLIEVNVNPSLNCDSNLDLEIKSRLISEIINIVGISGSANKSVEFSSELFQQNIKQTISKFKIKICKEFNLTNNLINFSEEESYYLNEIPEYQEMINNFKGEVLRSQLGGRKFEQIFPRVDEDSVNIINYYTKFFSNPGDENILLWKWIISNFATK